MRRAASSAGGGGWSSLPESYRLPSQAGDWERKGAPVAGLSPKPGGTIASQAKETRMAKTVLIVEDNELNMKLFHDLLEAHGYQTLGTRNGIEALDLARKHRPDLILMDIQLPEVSGLEVTKWLKDDPELKVIPVVAVTAFAMKGDEERIREGGCEAYLSKPISVGKFLETVRHFLDAA
jgi:two-component system cell cycle response regulator DivK